MRSKLVYLFTIVFLTVTSLSINGQIFTKNEADKIVSGCKTIYKNEKNKSIKFLQLRDDINQPAINKETWLKMSLNLTKSHNLKVIGEETDKIGYVHTRYQILYKNLPVEWAVYTVHSLRGKIISASGEYVLGKDIPVTPSIKEPDAFNRAITYVHAEKYKWSSENSDRPLGELIILPVDTAYVLAYKFDIYAIEPLSRQYIYLNAISGEVLKTISRIEYTDAVGTAKTMYNGTVNITTDHYGSIYRLRESGRGKGIETYNLNHSVNYGSAVDFTDNDNYWNDTVDHNNAAYDAHYGTEATYDYYYIKFGRNSYDNLGSKLMSYVHYDYNYVNAFWDGTCMTYGDGDGINYLPLTPIEVTAHEITHGVTEHSANLIYSGESGALNESFSDIFGIIIDFSKNPLTANYLMGDAMSPTHTPFRSMQSPKDYQCPDTYLGQYWDPYQEVHTNSTVQSYCYYLICEGGTGTNDNGDNYNVSAIGRDEAAAIAYRTLTVYLSPSATYADARFYSIQATVDLFGDCSPEAVTVTNAWYAVGVGTQFNNSIIADFSSSMTSACKTPTAICFYNKSTKATTYLWDFGDGSTETSMNPIHSYTNPGTYSVKLIAYGSALCNNIDTLIKNNYITVANGQSPLAPSCIPHTLNPGTGGIYKFSFNTIDKVTGGSIDDYQDYSCTDTSTVTEGREYPVGIKVGDLKQENIYVWLDLNNDGQFNNSNELLLQKNKINKQYTGNILMPGTTVYDTPIRLRVASDFSAYHLDSACSNSNYGQIQDYAVIVKQNLSAPEAEFNSSTQNLVSGDTIKFFDKSLNVPNSWQWSFTGGNPSSSTDANPIVSYDTPGTYDVILIAGNSHGKDTISKTGYIKVTTPPPFGLSAALKNKITGEVKLNWYKQQPAGLFENFDDGTADGWNPLTGTWTVSDGTYNVTTSGNSVSTTSFDNIYNNFEYEAKMRKISGYEFNLGIYFNGEPEPLGYNGEWNNTYVIMISTSGYWKFTKIVNGTWINFVEWTITPYVQTGFGTWNTLKVSYSAGYMDVYINDNLAGSYYDTTYRSGKIGLKMYDNSIGSAEFDDIMVIPLEGVHKFGIPQKYSSLNVYKSGKDLNNSKVNGEKIGSVVPAYPQNNPIYEYKQTKKEVSNVFKNFNIYRDSVFLDTALTTSYTDTLPIYGTYNYYVSSVYDQGESPKTGPAKLTWAKPLDGEDCMNAQNLADLSSPYSGTIIGYENNYSFCNMYTSPDRVFYVDLENTDSLIIGQTWNDYDSRYSIRYGGSCPGDTEIICVDDPDIQTHIYVNNSGATQRIYWVQGGCSYSYGNFILAWNVIHSSCPKPKHLQADSVGFHSAILSWAPGNTENKWDIEWGLKGFKHGQGTLDTGLTTNTYTLTGLLLGTQYDYYVRALCSDSDKSWWMGPYYFYTKGLDKPDELTAKVISPDAGLVELDWKASPEGIDENFDDGLAQNWYPVTGNWSVQKGVYQDSVTATYMANTSYYNKDFTNFEYEAKIRSLDYGTDYLGLIFNGDPKSLNSNSDWKNCYMLLYNSFGYWELEKDVADYSTTIFNGTSLDIIQGTNVWNTVKVVCSNGYIECIFNGVSQGTFYDTTYKSGKVGIHVTGYSYSSKAEFDNIKLMPMQDGYVFKKVIQNPVRNMYKNIYSTNAEMIGQEIAPVPSSESPFVYNIKDTAYFRIFRDSSLIDSTYSTKYIDTLKAYGVYNYKVTAVYTEGESKPAGPVAIHWYGNPLISVTPSSFDETLLSGDSVSRNMTIKNNGIGKLIFDINKSAVIVSPVYRKIPLQILTSENKRKSSTDTSYPDVKSMPEVKTGTKGKNVLIFRDNLAWGYNVNVPILESLGANVTVAGSTEMGSISLNKYALIIFESQQPTSFYSAYVSNINRFTSYLNSGGVLEFHCATYSSYRIPNLTLPGGMQTLVSADLDAYNYIVDPTHPIVAGVVGPLYGNSASHEAFQNLPAGAITITNNESSIPTTVEYKYGSGTVIATGMTWEWGYAQSQNFAKMLPNAFKYALTKESSNWLSTSPNTDTLDYGDSVNVTVKFNAKNLAADKYIDTLKIASTDVNHPITDVPCVLNVLGKPTADFTASKTTIIMGDSIQFTDQSIGSPTSWKWEFPGGTPSSSTLENPGVIYNTAGTYDVTLIASNAYGSDTNVMSGLINVYTNLYCVSNLGGQGYCPGDITNLSITGTTLNNTDHYSCSTANGSTYGSYPASDSTTGTIHNGQTYTVSVTTSSSDIISIWIDYNQDGVFEASEWNQVTTNSTPYVPSIKNITVPVNALSGATGMRIRSRAYGNQNGAYDACTMFGSGITEDYTITVDGSVIPDFTADKTGTCAADNIIFTNSSIGTITSYYWNFGSGAVPATATTVGPHSVVYTTSGKKTVSLTVNGFLIKTDTDYITISYKPSTPVVTQDGNLLVSSASTGNQWYTTQSGIISNATSKTYAPKISASYYVIVTIDGCSSDASNTYVYTNLIDLVNTDFNIYPVPVSNSLTIKSNKVISTVKLTGVTGETVFDQSGINVSTFNIDMSKYSSGVYILTINSKDNPGVPIIRKIFKK